MRGNLVKKAMWPLIEEFVVVPLKKKYTSSRLTIITQKQVL